jgi:hypothetical protein
MKNIRRVKMSNFYDHVFYKDNHGNRHRVYPIKQCQEYPENDRDSAPPIDVMNAWDNFLKLALSHVPDAKVGYIYNDEHRVAVFTDDCMVNMGELAMYCDPQNHEPTYHVTSHTIENRRFCPMNSKWEYRTVSSKSIDKAVSKARTYLRPNKLSDIVRCTFERARAARGDYNNRLERAFDTATRDLGFREYYAGKNPPDVLQEMLRVTDMGLVRFSDPIDAKLTAFVSCRDAVLNAHEYKRFTACWVHKDYKGDVVVDTHNINSATYSDTGDDGKGMTPYHKNFACANVQTYGNDVPEEVESKISVLSMLDCGEFVEEVGFKYDDNVYYLMNKEQ